MPPTNKSSTPKSPKRPVPKRQGKSRRLNQLTAHLLGPSLRARGITIHRIVTEWQTIAGDAASWSEPASISFPQGQQDHGTLTVAVQSGRGPEMQMLETTIVKHCNQVFGYRAIDRITISQTTLTPLRPADMPLPPAPNTIKPDAESAVQIQKTRLEITTSSSPELRKALDNLGKSLSGEDQDA